MLILQKWKLISQALALLLGLVFCSLLIYYRLASFFRTNSSFNLIDKLIAISLYGGLSFYSISEIINILKSKATQQEMTNKSSWVLLLIQSIWILVMKWHLLWVGIVIVIFSFFKPVSSFFYPVSKMIIHLPLPF
jgi:uncharacterized membrane-anchored protein